MFLRKVVAFSSVLLASAAIPNLALAESVRVAFLPVVVHTSDQESGHISEGLGDMLSARIERSGEVRVVRIQPAKLRLGLSMKQGTDPLKGIEVGTRCSGQVSRLADFGAFVRIPPGVEGLVHLSELSEYRVRHPEEVVTLGEDVTVKIIGVNRKRRTVDLSITQAVAPDLPEA